MPPEDESVIPTRTLKTAIRKRSLPLWRIAGMRRLRLAPLRRAGLPRQDTQGNRRYGCFSDVIRVKIWMFFGCYLDVYREED